MTRTFNGTTDKLVTSLGAVNGITAAFTVATILKSNADGGTNVYAMLGTSAPDARVQIFKSSADILCSYTTAVSAGITVKVADGWILLASTKAAGSATPRHHKYVYSSNTWTHSAADTAMGDKTPATSLSLGGEGTFGANASIAALGAWSSVLTDAQIESLAFDLNAWRQVNPAALWLFDQSATSMLVNDLTGGGANQSSLTGTSVATSNLPVFSYGAPIIIVDAFTDTTVTGTVAVTLDAFTSSASGGTGPAGTSAQTLGAFTSTASGATGPSGSSAQTLDAFTSSASGGTGPSGSSAQTLGDFVLSASGGTGPVGTLAVTLAAFLSLADGGTGPAGAIAVTLGAFTSSASGTAAGPSGDPGCFTITLSDPHTLTLTVADLGTLTLTLSDLGTLAVTIGECP